MMQSGKNERSFEIRRRGQSSHCLIFNARNYLAKVTFSYLQDLPYLT